MDAKTSQFGTITAIQANSAGTEGYIPYVDPSQVDPDLRNKRMTRSEAKKFFGLEVFTVLSGTSWDGTNKTLALTSNISLTFSSTRRNGILRVQQDGTGGRTLSINTVSVPVATGANTITVICFFYDDVAATYVFAYDTNVLGNVGGGGGDTTPPTVSGMAASVATHIYITFSESVTAPSLSGWSFKKNGSALVPSAVSLVTSGVWDFTMPTMAGGDTILASYNSSGGVQDLAGNPLASFTDVSVSNTIGATYDTESSSYFSAESISATGDKNAVDANLVKGLKTDALFTHFKIQYPFMGSTHARNLMNPADTNAAFRISYVGGWTHDAAGSTGNGTNNYGDTHFVPDTNLALADSTIVFAIGGAASSSDETVIGAYDSTGVTRAQRSNATGGNWTGEIDGPTGAAFFDPAGAAVYILTRNGSSISLYKNGTLLETKTAASTAKSVSNLFVGALNYVSGGSVIYYMSTPIKYIGILDKGVNATEAANINTRVQAFLTALGR